MTGKQFYIVWLLGLGIFMNGCGGNDAPPDSIITAVEEDKTTTIAGSIGGVVVDGAIHFKVTAAADDTTPVANATVNIFGTSPSLGDPFAGFVTNLLGGTFMNASNPNQVVLTTDAGGVVTVYYQFSVPACGTDDITASANINASIGGSTAIWLDDITIEAC